MKKQTIFPLDQKAQKPSVPGQNSPKMIVEIDIFFKFEMSNNSIIMRLIPSHDQKKPPPLLEKVFKALLLDDYSATTSNSTSVWLPLPKSIVALYFPSSFTSSVILIRRRSIS